jgi:hypothetical protein
VAPGRFGGILGPFVTGWLLQLHMGSTGLFAAIGTAVLLGACAILFARPGRLSGIRDVQTLVAN